MQKQSKQLVFQVWKRYPAFVKMQYSSILTGFTTWGAFVAMLVLLDKITDNGFQFGLLWALSGIAPMLFSIFLGVWVDRMDVKKSMPIVEVIRAFLYISFVAVPYLEGYSAWILYLVLRFFTGVLTSLNATSRQTVLPDIVKQEDLTVVNSLNYSISSIIRLSGAAVGGVLLTVTGDQVLWVINGIAFLISGWLFYSAGKHYETSKKVNFSKNFRAEFTAGLKIAKDNTWVRLVLLAGVTCGLIIGSFNLMLQKFVSDVYQMQDFGISVLYVAEGIVSAYVSFWIANKNFSFKQRKSTGYTYVLWGLLWVAFGFSQNVYQGALCLAMYGLVGAFNAPYERITMQTEVPAEMRGRVFGLWGSLITISIQIGAFLTGVIITAVGVKYVPVFFGAIECMFGVLFIVTVLRNNRITRSVGERMEA